MSQLLFAWRCRIELFTKHTNLGPPWTLAAPTKGHWPKCHVAMHA